MDKRVTDLLNRIEQDNKYKELLTLLKMVDPKYKYMFAQDGVLVLCEHQLENLHEQCTMITSDKETALVNMGNFLAFKYCDTTALFEKSGDSWGIRMVDGFFFHDVFFPDDTKKE